MTTIDDVVRAFREDLDVLERYARDWLVGLVACRGNTCDPLMEDARAHDYDCPLCGAFHEFDAEVEADILAFEDDKPRVVREARRLRRNGERAAADALIDVMWARWDALNQRFCRRSRLRSSADADSAATGAAASGAPGPSAAAEGAADGGRRRRGKRAGRRHKGQKHSEGNG